MTGPSRPSPQFITTPLESQHHRAAFVCGKDSLDNYLRDRALPDAKRLATITFVSLNPADEVTIRGYYSLSSTGVALDKVPAPVLKQLRVSKHRLLSATLIGRLAVASAFQGQHLGKALLFDALKRAYFAATQVGSLLIMVHALDDEAEAFYRHHGFQSFTDLPRELYLPTGTVASLVNVEETSGLER